MNIRTIQCPSCGANLKVEDLNQSLFYCNYCGAAIQLETNHNKGYDMEMGRLDARGELADKIVEKIEKIKDKLIANGNADYYIKYYPHKIAELKDELHLERTSGWGEYVIKPFGIGFAVLFAGAIFVVALNSILPKFLLTLLELLLLAAPIYLPVIGLIKKLKIHSSIKLAIEDCKVKQVQAQQVFDETEAYLNENAEVDIPRRFRSEASLNYIIKGLKAREFISLDQAFFRIEEAGGMDNFFREIDML